MGEVAPAHWRQPSPHNPRSLTFVNRTQEVIDIGKSSSRTLETAEPSPPGHTPVNRTWRTRSLSQQLKLILRDVSVKAVPEPWKQQRPKRLREATAKATPELWRQQGPRQLRRRSDNQSSSRTLETTKIETTPKRS